MQNIVPIILGNHFIFDFAIFKLRHLGYIVVICGFTDRSRGYHVVVVMIVIQRAQREYREGLSHLLGPFADIQTSHYDWMLQWSILKNPTEW